MVYPEESNKTFGKYYVQWIATLGVFILMLQIGIMIGWTAPNLVRLTAEDSDIKLTQDDASWIASLVGLGGFPGAIISCFILEILGSKKTIHLAFFIITICWTLLLVADSVSWLYASRLICGISGTLAYSSFSLYLGEVADPKIRGTLISIAACGNPFGIVFGTIAETYLAMKVSTSIYVVQCLAAIVLFFWLQDSPYNLVKRSNLEGAKKSVAFYHKGCEVEKEFNEIKDFVEVNSSQTMMDKLRELKTSSVRKSMFIILVVFALPHLSGMMAIASYMGIILINAKSYLIKPEEFVIYANIAQVVVSFFTVKLIDKLGRRFLLISSGVGTAIGLAGLGIHFNLLDSNYDMEKIQWLPIVSILIYLLTYSVGYTPVPSTMLSELFPMNVKSMAALFAALSASMFSFAMSKSYQPVVDSLGQSYIFWIHAGLALLSVPFALFVMPETKGKTFQEIQNVMTKR